MNKRKSLFVATLLATLMLSSSLLGQVNAKVRATTLKPAQQAAYIFEVVFDSDVSLSSQIEIVFPRAFNLNPVKMAASDKLDGTLKIETTDSSLVIRRQNARTPIRAGEPVDFKVASILNPNEMAQDWEFKVVVRENEREIEQKLLSTAIEQITNVTR